MDDFAKFLDALKSLDATVARIDHDLVGAADIRESLQTLVSFKLEHDDLPGTFADLLAEKAKVDARVPRREQEARKAKHGVLTIETKLKKLGESLDHNVSNLAATPEADPSATAQAFGLKLPATRRERIEQLKLEIAEVEASLAEPKALHKKAAALYKSDVTRAKNLGQKIAETGKLIEQNRKRLPEMAKLARKTAEHLKNRQEHRDRKAAERLAKQAPVAETPVVEAVAAVTDEDLRRKAEQYFGQPVTDEQLSELRGDSEFLDA